MGIFDRIARIIYTIEPLPDKNEFIEDLLIDNDKLIDPISEDFDSLFEVGEIINTFSSEDKELERALKETFDMSQKYFRTVQLNNENLFLNLLALSCLYKNRHKDVMIGVNVSDVILPGPLSIKSNLKIDIPRTFYDLEQATKTNVISDKVKQFIIKLNEEVVKKVREEFRWPMQF